MSKGWIKLHRSIQDCLLWNDKPFDKCRAWIDLLLLANHSDARIMFDGQPMTVSAGCFITSSVKLSERWGWSRSKVDRFLKMLQDEQMVELDVNRKRTAITIVNYGKFQEVRATDEQVTSNSRTTDEQLTSNSRATDEQLTNINKNEKNNKNDKNDKNVKNEKDIRHKYGSYSNVLLTDEQYQKLINEFPNDYEQRIERLSEYIASTGKRYKDHLATIRSWARKDTTPKQSAYMEAIRDRVSIVDSWV